MKGPSVIKKYFLKINLETSELFANKFKCATLISLSLRQLRIATNFFVSITEYDTFFLVTINYLSILLDDILPYIRTITELKYEI